MMADNQQKDHEEPQDNNEGPTAEAIIVQPEEHGQQSKAEVHTLTTLPSGSKLKRVWQWLHTHKKISIPAITVVVLAVLAAVPFTRYVLAGLVVKQDYAVVVLDNQTSRPVTSATVLLGDKSMQTDGKGRVKLNVSAGEAKLAVTKKYYKTSAREVIVPIGKQQEPLEVRLEATGRQVPVTVLNRISGKPVSNAVVKAVGTETKTDEKGEAIAVVPAEKTEVRGTIETEDYNIAKVTIKVTADKILANTFSITPSGKLYFLSNASGKLDVIKANLDGTDRQTVLPGTGQEDKYNTVLLASRDWKYIGLFSKRDGSDKAKVLLLETDTDKLTVIDEGDAEFALIGWSGDRLVYTVTRNTVNTWEPKRQALKSYHAPARKIVTLDETTAEGNENDHRYQLLGETYVLDQEVLYTKNWDVADYYGEYNSQDKQITFNSAKSDGSQKKVVKEYNPPYQGHKSIDTRPAEFGEVYIRYATDGGAEHDEYKGGKVAKATLTDEEFYDTYPTYAVSPSGKKTLWSEYRDGKNVFFVGDNNGANGKQIGASEEYTVYGWHTDNYVLLTRKNSELRIMSASGSNDNIETSLKVSDYYKPNYVVRGYGYGYGG